MRTWLFLIVVIGAGVGVLWTLEKHDAQVAAEQEQLSSRLGGIRTFIANHYAETATPAGGGTPRFPTLEEVRLEMQSRKLKNPHATSDAPLVLPEGSHSTEAHWLYDPTTGEIRPGASGH